jgi:hypothetical protein
MEDIKVRIPGKWKHHLMQKEQKNFSQWVRDAIREKLERTETKVTYAELNQED